MDPVIRAMEGYIVDAVTYLRLPPDMEREIFTLFRAQNYKEAYDLISSFTRTYGDSIQPQQLASEIQYYVEKRARDIEAIWRGRGINDRNQSSFNFNRSSQDRGAGSYNFRASDVFSARTDSPRTPAPVSYQAPGRTYQQEPVHQPEPKLVKEAPVAGTWTLTEQISELINNRSIGVSETKTTLNDKPIDHKIIEIGSCVNHPYEAIIQAQPYISSMMKNPQPPFIMDITVNRSRFVNVAPSVLLDLCTYYTDEKLFDRIDTDNVIALERRAKAVVNALKTFFGRITYDSAIAIETFFIQQFRSLVRSHLVNPDELDTVKLPSKLDEIDEFFDSGSISEELGGFPMYAVLRDYIVSSALLQLSRPEAICDWDDLIDRVSICNNLGAKKILIDQYSMTHIAVASEADQKNLGKVNLSEMIKAQKANLTTFSVLKCPMRVIYTNIVTNDMLYKLGAPEFDAYTFQKPGNILEEVMSESSKQCIERYVFIAPDKYQGRWCLYGDIVDKTIRVAPVPINVI